MDTIELLRKVRRIQIHTSRLVNDVLAGQYHSSFKGRGMEFDEVREYQPGDDVRTIDWNVTARFGHPYVKNYREERELTAMLLVDVSRSTYFGTGNQLKSDLATELAAVIAFSAVANNDKVGLVMFTDKIELFVPPKKGKKHVLRVIRELLNFTPESRHTDISMALRYMNRIVPRRVICFLLSDFMTDGYEMDLRLTARRHDLVAITITDPAESELPGVGLMEVEDAETGKRLILDTSTATGKRRFRQLRDEEWENRENLLRSARVDSIRLVTDQSYIHELSVFFKMRMQRR